MPRNRHDPPSAVPTTAPDRVSTVPGPSGVGTDAVAAWTAYGKLDGVYYLMDPWTGGVEALHARYQKLFRIAGYRRTA